MRLTHALPAFWHRPRIPDDSLDEYRTFLEAHHRRRLVPLLTLGTVIMLSFIVVDIFVVPDVLLDSLTTRLFMVLPVAVVGLAFLSSRRRRLEDFHAGAILFPVYYGTLACILLVRSDAPLAPLYMGANNITIMFAVLILGLPPLPAASTGLALVAIQAVLLSGASYATAELTFLLTTTSLLVTCAAFFGNWRADLDRRLHFLARRRDKELVSDLSAQNALLERLSALDPLTGLSNRRGLDAVLRSAVRDTLHRPANDGLALAMIDIDHFKLFNDTQGHAAGDEILHQVGRALSRAGPECELAARYGGEEFVIVMPGIAPHWLEMTGARLKASVERLAIPHPASPTSRVLTVSIGIVHADRTALLRFDDETAMEQALVRAADAALYKVKANGRNAFAVESVAAPTGAERLFPRLADAS